METNEGHSKTVPPTRPQYHVQLHLIARNCKRKEASEKIYTISVLRSMPRDGFLTKSREITHKL